MGAVGFRTRKIQRRMAKQIAQLDRPKRTRSYVTVTDPESRKSRYKTIYGVTPDQVMAALLQSFGLKPSRDRARENQPA
jgi:hypothetical protein